MGMMTGGLLNWFDGPAAPMWVAFGVAYVFGGWEGTKASVHSLRAGTVDIDILMMLAALGALIINAPFEGAMLLFLFSLSEVMQDYAMGRSRRAIHNLMALRPDEAKVVRPDGSTETMPLHAIDIDTVVRVRPGDTVPLDGTVTKGESTVDQSSVTGESVPVDKQVDDPVYAGTTNMSGSLDIRVTRSVHESTIARLIDMVEAAQRRQAPTQQLLERIEQPYAIGVLVVTALFVLVPVWGWGEALPSAFYRAMTLMVAASPCALIISTPAAVLSAIAGAARRGVLYKGGAYVEATADIKAVAFDKTGTLTTGDTELDSYTVRSGATVNGSPVSEADLLRWAAAVQQRSEHHLAAATVDAAQAHELALPEAQHFDSEAGKGVRATVNGAVIHIGNPRYYAAARFSGRPVAGMEEAQAAVQVLQDAGTTAVLVVQETDEAVQVLGWMSFADQLRVNAAETVNRLRALGIKHIVMLTGDNEAVARAVAQKAGLDAYYAELLPEEKVDLLKKIEDTHGPAIMVGDGVNDAPALATAHIGIAMGGAGSDVALETADIALMGDDLSKIPYALRMSQAARRTLRVNFGLAFGAIAIMLVTIVWTGLPLPLAVIGHEGSTVLVSLNGLRLLGFRE